MLRIYDPYLTEERAQEIGVEKYLNDQLADIVEDFLRTSLMRPIIIFERMEKKLLLF